jgi:hypothetical protein
MKKTLPLLAITFLLTSCKDYWPEEDKRVYYQTCYDDAVRWAASEADAKTYCDCVVEKVTTKYKTVDELMEHAMEIKDDPDVKKCMEGVPLATQ